MNRCPGRWVLWAVAVLVGFPSVKGNETGQLLRSYLKREVNYVSEALKRGESELIVNGFAYHSHSSYSKAQLDRLNSEAWGVGFGRSFTDFDGNRHQVYAVGFADSHNRPEFHVGFNWLHPVLRHKYGLVVEVGFTAFFFLRKDSLLPSDYIPLPGLLPLVTIGGSRTKLNMTWIPRIGERLQGNVLYLCIMQSL